MVLRDVVYTTNTTKILQVCSTDFQNCTTKNEHTLDIMEIFQDFILPLTFLDS